MYDCVVGSVKPSSTGLIQLIPINL